MPLAGPILGGLILQEFLRKNFTGSQNSNLAMAIGNGVITNILTTNFYQGQSIGIGTGAGIGTGKIYGITGFVTGNLIHIEMLAKNLKGSQGRNFALAIGTAFATHIKTGIVTSISTPVVSGTGTGRLKGIVGATLGNSVYGMMLVSALTGSQNLNLAMAIGIGIAKAIKLGIITTTIVGVGYPPVSVTGTDIGKMI